mmetsp:Transcript_44365/g.111523  ORF Transcript_44365/g.111523 Transcript_44365/m.111523 type:complete len:387 (+) Transcript_44365:64-1224(+)
MTQCAADSLLCSAWSSATGIDSCETAQIAPQPFRSLVTRLRIARLGDRAWHAYLPQRLRQYPEILAASMAAVPTGGFRGWDDDEVDEDADDDGDADDNLSRREVACQNRSSTCSTCVEVTLFEESCSEGPSVVGCVRELSRDPIGSRIVQAALEKAESEEQRCLLAHELRGHMHETMCCPHGNHVVQKIISTMQRPESLQFIIDALTQQDSSIVEVAKHKYASRIVKHLLKVCPAAQVSEVMENLLAAASTLACHMFGRFLVQHVLDSGTREQQYRLLRTIEQNALRISQTCIGRSVLEILLTHTAIEDQDKAWMARACAQDSEVLLRLALGKLGHTIVLLMLEILEPRRDQRVSVSLAQHLDTLRASEFGRIVAQRLDVVGAEYP